MGVHIFATPYKALKLDVPRTIINSCREPNGFGFPENNVVTYEFPGTDYTDETLTWIWNDGPGALDSEFPRAFRSPGGRPDSSGAF